MATLMSRFPLGDMAALYLTDEEKHVGFLLVPAETESEIVKKDCAVDSLVQVHVRGGRRVAFFREKVKRFAL